jgi:SnoaL-like domain
VTVRPELVEIAHAHAAAEAADDFDTVMATLEDDPVYELQPRGIAFRGRDAARTYYEHFFVTVKPMIAGYDLRNEWVNDEGVAQEYVIHFALPDGSRESHPVMAILTFGETALSGERLYASDRLLELLFGPALELARPLAPTDRSRR